MSRTKKIKSESKSYNNVPPKGIQNAIWGGCFDYKDFNKMVNGMTIRDRIYEAWNHIHLGIKQWIEADEKDFLDYIKNHTPDINQNTDEQN